jgi:WD40 repeat protein
MATVYELKKTNKNRNKKKKHRLLKVTASVVMLAVISVTAAVLITNGGKINAEGFTHLFSGTINITQAAEFSFDGGTGSVFADMDGGLAVCSGGGIQVYDVSARRMFIEAFEMTCPAVCSNGSVSAAYDLGGKLLKVFDLYGVTKSISAEGKIISASINKSSWLALCSQGSGGVKGRVTVYDANGETRYYWDSAEGYILSAAVSADNKSLAVLTLTEKGSRIVFFSLSSPDEKGSCTLTGALVLEIRYLSDGRVLAVSKDALRVVKPDGSADVIKNYTDKYLVCYTIGSENFTALALNDYLVGDQGSIVTVDRGGKVLGTLQTSRKILSISSSGDNAAVLYNDGLVIYDRTLKEIARFNNTVGAEQTIMRSDGKALLISPHSAAVCNTKSSA